MQMSNHVRIPMSGRAMWAEKHKKFLKKKRMSRKYKK